MLLRLNSIHQRHGTKHTGLAAKCRWCNIVVELLRECWSLDVGVEQLVYPMLHTWQDVLLMHDTSAMMLRCRTRCRSRLPASG
jgi:hypothetical protein